MILHRYIPCTKEWESFCNALDELLMNNVDRNSTIFMRFTLMIAIACLVLVILFGYMDSDEDDDDDDDNEQADDDGSISTLLVVLTAVPICFPFIMAALLNCHASATVAKIVRLCETTCEQWAAAAATTAEAQRTPVTVKVELLESVSNEDEAIHKVLIEFVESSSSPLLSNRKGSSETAREEEAASLTINNEYASGAHYLPPPEEANPSSIKS